ncbi:MAG: hypothetical protein SVK54_05645 [candidate division WOR-3 bacterium]|nr:hypothetical protein [candidate division WOR-3 bacterium]
MKYEAYWIKPDGDIIPVKTRHIDLIIQRPGEFDLSEEYIKEQFRHFNEPLGREGKARREIMKKLIEDGFIRVRFKPKEWIWYMECNVIDTNTEIQVKKWIEKIGANENNKCKPILIQSIKGEKVKYEC